MRERLVVHRIEPVRVEPRGYRFHVELRVGEKAFRVEVDAADLLDFDKFQAATLSQTGRLIMPPCSDGAEGPEHYRRHRRVWLGELERAEWSHDGAAAGAPVAPTDGPSGRSARPAEVAISQGPHWIYAYAARSK